MTDDEMIDYLVNASAGSMVPVDFHSDLALMALARRIVKLEQRITDVLYHNELWDGS